MLSQEQPQTEWSPTCQGEAKRSEESLGIISHELRTPLTSIRSALGLLASGKLCDLPEHGRRMLEIASQNTERLERLIDDILNLERLERGVVPLELSNTDIATVVASVAQDWDSRATMAGVLLRLDLQPACVRVDTDLLRQAISNVVCNAVKFSAVGDVVGIRIRSTGKTVRIIVCDQGPGIPQNQLESIFKRFQQVDSSDARRRGGIGLGLAISRALVRQQGGQIWAEIPEAGGSIFTIELPVVAAV